MPYIGQPALLIGTSIITLLWSELAVPALIAMIVVLRGRGFILRGKRKGRGLVLVTLVGGTLFAATYFAARWICLGGEIDFDQKKCESVAKMIEAGTLGAASDDYVKLPPGSRDLTVLGEVVVYRQPSGRFQFFWTWHRHGAVKGYAYCPAAHSQPPTPGEIERDEALIKSVFFDPSTTAITPTRWPAWYYVSVNGG